ncbi:PREDICTED: selenium-binding protein 1-A-like [Nicrophorus vespilloides]|uniref:Selenium-binding protein 1-A-like n=1 Tax=Nicrophorus vespilloides TaxID=110193 RepID=A0ABM1M3E3_NICVS|nr:PREDICTED: selenium-binding protein 1-A-like [Nicrophorus vespilloides]
MAPSGPGYATPLDAMNKGPKEELLYVICVQPNAENKKGDILSTVDVNPKSSTYQQIIHRLPMGKSNDEIHHSGWNSCSSCYGCKGMVRDKLILPCLGSDRIIIVETGKNPRAPSIHKTVEAAELHALNCATPHTIHCLASGEIMINSLGDTQGNGKCDFILFDGKTFKPKGTWTNGRLAKFGYDFWYQPHFDVMISTEWGAPRVFKTGFLPSHVIDPNAYGTSLNFYCWSKRELIQTIDLGPDGCAPLEVRFLHNPKECQGYVGCAVMSNVYRFYKKEDGTFTADKVIDVKGYKVAGGGWPMEYMQGFVSDIILSLDDKYLYLNNWIQGDVRQYDITDRAHPKLISQVFLGGKLVSDSPIKVVEEEFTPPNPVTIKGKRLKGGPQMMQLSLDGKRLYVSNSLFSVWDRQFYPDAVEDGGWIAKIDIDHKNGGMKLDENFVIDFGKTPDGAILAHEMRYPGGDCTSDIWLPK